MKTRLFALLLALTLALCVLPAAAEEITPLNVGGMAVFDDCTVFLNEIAWYGRVEGNVLTPANGAPTMLAIRMQVLNRAWSNRDFGLDSGITVHYGTAFSQTGIVVEELENDADGLRFYRDTAVSVGPLQAKNIVAYCPVSPLMYYSPEVLEVDLVIGGHRLQAPLGAADEPADDPYVVQPSPDQGGAPYFPSYTAQPAPAESAGGVIRIGGQTQVTRIELSVPVRYVDENGRALQNDTYLTVPLGGMAALTAPDIAGYVYNHYSFVLNGRSQTGYGLGIAVYDNGDGALDKQSLTLHYRAERPAYTPAQAVTTYRWDTQFRPGIATAPDGRGDNANVYLSLDNLHDNNPNTSLSWLLYVSERTDGIPEFTVGFSNASISAIGVRNGKTTSERDYRTFARLASIHLRIHTTTGDTLNTWVTLPDEYHADYQVLPLEKTYNNVSSIELWIEGGANQGFYMGEGEYAYTIHVTDIQFYAPGATPAAPTATPGIIPGYSY